MLQRLATHVSRRGRVRLTLASAALLLAVGAGWLAALGHVFGAVVVLGVSILTSVAPALVPALLLVGLGFVHLLTYLSVGFVTRADVLAEPTKLLPILGALFGPPVVAGVLRRGNLLPAGALSWRDPRGFLLWGMLALLALLLIGLGTTPTPLYGLTKSFGFAAFSVFPAMLVFVIAGDRLDVKRVMVYTVLVGSLWIVIALSMALTKGDLNLYLSSPGELFGGTNQAGRGLGGRAAIVAIAALGIALWYEKGWRRYLAASALALVAIVWSGHRGSAIGFVAGILVLLLMSRRRWGRPARHERIVSSVLLLGFACWLAWQSAPGFIADRYVNPFQSVSFQFRLSAQQLALKGWAEAPILGNGTGSTAFMIAGADQPAFGVVRGLYPHNVAVELLAELGVVGLAVYLVTIVGTVVLGYRAARRESDVRWLIAVLLGLVTRAFVSSLGGGDLNTHNELWIVAALLAVTASDTRRYTEHQGSLARGQHVSGTEWPLNESDLAAAPGVICGQQSSESTRT